MTVSTLKKLFMVAFMGAFLTACSSTPKTDEASDTSATETGAASSDSVQSESAGVADPTPTTKETRADAEAELEGLRVHFDFDKSEIKNEYFAVIKQQADFLANYKDATVTVKGYCDERGSREYNLALGERRANAVKNALMAEGVSSTRINIISYGEENPIDPRSTEEAWAKNRRAEFAY
ncbi:MAG: peptidoglycan-associated lipoprotein Pal [Hydrogenovibrio sp.]|uniref:peptidoglycan-associated lipoprotein Pal n=1 Tax=Hydrogenovibrio sp. TaxID=2065821 RepID=UPI002870AAA0|nr:peptidoglycan-associated lipoprotein Pal [Hydrogenovibrio sp.]MDR9499333.1 peptidoglycan-associated lipoprotein Pal [Hydrogenovibrio sp.]